jgi:hypothetical protein
MLQVLITPQQIEKGRDKLISARFSRHPPREDFAAPLLRFP